MARYKKISFDVRVRRTGPYTMVEVKGPRLEGVGVTRKNPNDVEDPSTGYRIALGRALRDYADRIEF
jgi:hypothetical protein